MNGLSIHFQLLLYASLFLLKPVESVHTAEIFFKFGPRKLQALRDTSIADATKSRDGSQHLNT